MLLKTVAIFFAMAIGFASGSPTKEEGVSPNVHRDVIEKRQT